MRPAEGEADVALLGERTVAGVTVDLETPLKPERCAIGCDAVRSGA
jgi:hypothetical protein